MQPLARRSTMGDVASPSARLAERSRGNAGGDRFRAGRRWGHWGRETGMDDGTLDSRENDAPMKRPESGAAARLTRRAALGALAALVWEARALAQTPPPPAGAAPGQTLSASDALAAQAPPAAPDWPRVIKAGDTTLNVYLPQLDSWDGTRLEVHSAVSVQSLGQQAPIFGVAFIAEDKTVDTAESRVKIEQV